MIDNKEIYVYLLTDDPTGEFRGAMERQGYGRLLMRTPGGSIRDGLKELLDGSPAGVLLADPAAGYTAADAEKAASELKQNPDRLYVGEPREPEKRNIVEQLYLFLAGVDAATAQSGLFAMSAETAQIMVNMKSAEESFLMNIPLEARADSIDVEVLKTNVAAPAPDFHLLTKSFKLYYVFLKFSIAAMIAYLVDIGTFGLFELWFGFLSDEYKILVATVLSRILCSIATYILNKGAVFRSTADQKGAVIRFVILAVAQLVASWLLVWGIGSLFGGSDLVNMILKVVVDFAIFMASFTIQRDWVFKKAEPKSE